MCIFQLIVQHVSVFSIIQINNIPSNHVKLSKKQTVMQETSCDCDHTHAGLFILPLTSLATSQHIVLHKLPDLASYSYYRRD